MKPCIGCRHHVSENGINKCFRPRTMEDGTVHAGPHFCEQETDDEYWFTWGSLHRAPGDVCGKNAKHWTAKT